MRNHVLTSHFHNWITKLMMTQTQTQNRQCWDYWDVKGTVLCTTCYILLNSYLTRQIKCSADYAAKKKKKNCVPTLVSPLKHVCV